MTLILGSHPRGTGQGTASRDCVVRGVWSGSMSGGLCLAAAELSERYRPLQDGRMALRSAHVYSGVLHTDHLAAFTAANV